VHVLLSLGDEQHAEYMTDTTPPGVVVFFRQVGGRYMHILQINGIEAIATEHRAELDVGAGGKWVTVGQDTEMVSVAHALKERPALSSVVCARGNSDIRRFVTQLWLETQPVVASHAGQYKLIQPQSFVVE
jgi:hypothetical protein